MPAFHRDRPLLLCAFVSWLLVACSDGERSPDPAGPPAGNPGDVALRVVPLGDGRGAVNVTVPDRPGLECRQSCTSFVAPGTEVLLTALPGLNAVVRGWSVPTCGSEPTCSVRVDAETTLEVTMDLGFNVAFVTSLAYPVTLLPRPGDAANQECAGAAAAARLHGSRYVAWISAEGPSVDPADDVQPAAFFQRAGGWVRPDGQPVALSLASLLRGEILHTISLDERGAAAPARASWAATSAAGVLARTSDGRALTCSDWSDPDELLSGGIASGETTWIGEGFAASCDGALSLLCFGDDSDAELPVPRGEGRLAFTSGTTFAPGGGIASADALCQLEACEAGLTGSSSCDSDPGTARVFKAFLHTSTQAAWERFNLAGPAWVRTDGVTWLPTAADLAADGRGRQTSLNVRADGSYLSPVLSWAGNIARTATCRDWTSTSGADQGGFGRPSIVDGNGLSDTRLQSCAPPNNAFALVCLED